MFTVAKILEMLPREGGVELKTLEKMLKLTKKIERTRLDIALNALTKLKIIEKDNENFEFNQDLEVDEGTRSPGWIRYLKRIK